MTAQNPLLAQAQASAEDQTVTTTFENDIIPAGPTFARFIGYVEVGLRKQSPYKGVAKADCAEVRLAFELNGPKHLREIEVEGSKKMISNVISIKLTKKSAENSGFISLFRKMAYGRDIKSFVGMLGEPFLITITHNKGTDKDGKEKTYANMRDAEFNYQIGAPCQTNPATGEMVTFEVPAPLIPLRLFLWNQPTKEQWASVFIEGTRTVKRGGKDVTESKNWLQEDMTTNAINFPGSALEVMLAGMDDLEMAGDVTGVEDTPEATPAPEGDTPAQPSDDAAEAAQALFDQLGV